MTDTDTGVPTAEPADNHDATGPRLGTFETDDYVVLYDEADPDRWIQSDAAVALDGVR